MLSLKLRVATVVSALVAAPLGFASSAHAEFCPPSFTFPTQTDAVCVTDRATTRVLFQTASEAGPQEVFVAIAGTPLLPGFSAGLVFLTEPAGSPPEPGGFPGLNLGSVPLPSNVSDILALRLGVTPGPPTIDIAFLSDGAPPGNVTAFNAFVAGLPGIASLPETGAWQDLSAFFGVPAGSVFAQSDGDVPEPASIGLLGAALAAMGVAGLRRRRQS